MNLNQNRFIGQSETGRNPWWSYVILLLASFITVVLLNQVMNKVLVPILKSSGLMETIGQDTFSYVFVGLVFTVLLLALKWIHPLLHHRSFASLINVGGKAFRWKLYWRGFLQWGILLLIMQLVEDFSSFQNFVRGFNLQSFLVVTSISAIALFFQTFWEELIFRCYLLQNVGRRFVGLWIPNLIIAVLFSLAHFGYGLGSLLSSAIYSVFLVLLTIKDDGIERASGIHFVNNFLLLTFFVKVDEVTNATFSWDPNWLGNFTLLVSATLILLWSKAIPLGKSINLVKTT